MTRPRPESQAGRILHLLESAHGGKVSLLEVLSLRISQYNSRIHDLRHKYGFPIESGSEPGRPDHTWFRLLNQQHSSVPSAEANTDNMASEVIPGLFAIGECHKDLN